MSLPTTQNAIELLEHRAELRKLTPHEERVLRNLKASLDEDETEEGTAEGAEVHGKIADAAEGEEPDAAARRWSD